MGGLLKREGEETRAWFTGLIGAPAVLGWIAYGLAWLLAPRLGYPVEPIAWAGAAVGAYYSVAAMIVFMASGV